MSQTDEPEKIESEDKKETSFDDEQKEYQLNKDIPINFSVEPLDFDKTPQRNKELHRFEQILNAPIYNIPMLIVEKHEDVLPLLSLYANEKNTGFLSVTPSVFDMDYMNFRDYHDVEKKMNKVGTMLECGDLNGEIPVYCDLLDYMEHELWKPFVENFLKSSRPFVIVARKEEASELKEEIEKDFKISGGLEKPAEPHIPQALAKVKVYAHVKIPNAIRTYSKHDIIFDYTHGGDFPESLSGYKLVVHCGACMFNKTQMMARIQQCLRENVPITNFGLLMAKLNNIHLADIS